MTQATGQQLDAYRQTTVATASPLDLVIMLYDGAIRFLEQAKKAMAASDYSRQNENLTKAQRIITELSVCLDLDRGGELARNLMSLYIYMNNRLAEANISDDQSALDEVAGNMRELREAWATVPKKNEAA